MSDEHSDLVAQVRSSQTEKLKERPSTPLSAPHRWSDWDQIRENAAERARTSRGERKWQAGQEEMEGEGLSAEEGDGESKNCAIIDQRMGELTCISYRIKGRPHQGESCRTDGQRTARTHRWPCS